MNDAHAENDTWEYLNNRLKFKNNPWIDFMIQQNATHDTH